VRFGSTHMSEEEKEEIQNRRMIRGHSAEKSRRQTDRLSKQMDDFGLYTTIIKRTALEISKSHKEQTEIEDNALKIKRQSLFQAT
jgi:hypothetical protein